MKKGAVFMVNMTNEGWFGETALHQKVAASVFRAVENRVFVVRSTNTGISMLHRSLWKDNREGSKEWERYTCRGIFDTAGLSL